MSSTIARITLALLLATACATASATTPDDRGCERIEIFHRHGCPHCARALEFLDRLALELPWLVVDRYEISEDVAARKRFVALNERFEIARPGVPSMLACGHYMVGFSAQETPARIIEIVRRGDATTEPDTQSIRLPLFGEVSLGELGLPLFTVAIGLLDGFNPCAMWVLLFLLSLLVNLRDRRRILTIAVTFVMASGIVYFLFMAAWLNAFLVLGVSRALQLAIGALALLMGFVHVKDFISSGNGPSLSIPAAAKPGIYARMRAVVQAENLPAALTLVVFLAVSVNLLELLCTAGLPALYTRILTMQQMSGAAYYWYLALYNVAYMFDDAVMVGVVVYSLQRAKLQPEQGRWLKLVSGVVVIALGVLLMVSPDLLV